MFVVFMAKASFVNGKNLMFKDIFIIFRITIFSISLYLLFYKISILDNLCHMVVQKMCNFKEKSKI